ncbi:MAG: selenocysteine-specific translation elongation factor [Myxococcales bacterium]|nr:selenocysteine-specific translation elongation factor [Myxococcales bacterium]MCB9700752.1 selenocysteine-specific translation elongation factor [Myxococcales bacterium]
MAKAPRSLVLGTAGHIDHGKTTLVRALTGVDTDRLAEEKRRGITIELGFAAWPIAAGLEASIVDVPGHEGLVRTMVAGAGGIDLVLLVISAEDGVMPQTREHLSICSLLGITHGVVALTKIDRVGGDPEAIELATEDVREVLAGTALAEAPIIPCSAHTGEGLDALRSAIRRVIAALPRRPSDDRPILPIDRVFTMKGHGTVATGTLLSGRLQPAREPNLTLVPCGEGREVTSVRVRGLQVRGEAAELARAGIRSAVNLGGIATSELHRGDVLTLGARVSRADVLHAVLEHLSHDSGPWEQGAAVEVCAGTAHASGVLDPLAGLDDAGAPRREVTIPAGGRGLVRIRLEPPIPTWHGQRVIVRRLHDTSDPWGDTIGGGVVVDPQPSRGRGQRRRWIAVAEGLAADDPAGRALALIADAGALGIDRVELERRAGLVGEAIDAALAGLVADGIAATLGDGRWVTRAVAQDLADEAVAIVDRFHDEHPLQPGLGRAAVEGMLGGRIAADVAGLALELACRGGDLIRFDDQGIVARPGRGLAKDGFPPALQAVLDLYEAGGIAPPTIKEVEAATGMTSRQALDAISILQRAAALVRVTNELSLASRHHERLVELVRDHLRERGEIDVQALKGLTGLSRKFVVPVLEHLDRLQITRREGERRVPGGRAQL